MKVSVYFIIGEGAQADLTLKVLGEMGAQVIPVHKEHELEGTRMQYFRNLAREKVTDAEKISIDKFGGLNLVFIGNISEEAKKTHAEERNFEFLTWYSGVSHYHSSRDWLMELPDSVKNALLNIV